MRSRSIPHPHAPRPPSFQPKLSNLKRNTDVVAGRRLQRSALFGGMRIRQPHSFSHPHAQAFLHPPSLATKQHQTAIVGHCWPGLKFLQSFRGFIFVSWCLSVAHRHQCCYPLLSFSFVRIVSILSQGIIIVRLQEPLLFSTKHCRALLQRY